MKTLHKGVIQFWQNGLGHEITIVKAAQKLIYHQVGMMAHAYNPSNGEAEAGTVSK